MHLTAVKKMKAESNNFGHSLLENDVLGDLNTTMNNAHLPGQNQASVGQQSTESNDWEGVDKTVSDPEEARVIFSALDSFA